MPAPRGFFAPLKLRTSEGYWDRNLNAQRRKVESELLRNRQAIGSHQGPFRLAFRGRMLSALVLMVFQPQF